MSTYRGTPKQLSQIIYDLDKEKVYEVREYKQQRNSQQNRMYWKLLGELSIVTKIGIEELHFNMLKNYSQRYEILVPCGFDIRGIDYYEKKSKIIKNGKEFYVCHVYTPSHELNTSEFAVLMNGLIEECQQVGIDTRSPEEIKRDEGLEIK